MRSRDRALRQLTNTCKPDTVFCNFASARADGSRVLIPSGDGQTTVVDLATGRRTALPAAAFLAGRFAAWRTSEATRPIVVYALTAQREVPRVPTGVHRPMGGPAEHPTFEGLAI